MADLKHEIEMLRAELECVRREYQEFIYIVSHDLNAPPRKMMAFASRLGERLGSELDEKSQHYLDRIVANAQMMQQQMEALLRVSRCRPVNDPALIDRVALDDLMRDLAVELGPSMEAAGACLEAADGLPALTGNRQQLRQLFLELLNNALANADAGRPLQISVECAECNDHHCVIAVRDNGRGFDNRFSDTIFRIFQHLGPSEHGSGKAGVGAGLSIAQKVAETHGGRITANGEPGVGASFFVELALEYPQQSG